MCDKRYFLYGAGGHAKVIMDMIEAAGGRIEGVIDDNPDLTEFMGKEVLHGYPGSAPIIVSIGINGIRRKVVEKLGSETVFGTAIHPSAILSPHATVGEGSVVMQGAILQSCAKVGKHCIINTGASVDHDCILGDYVHISPHATLCGNVSVGEGSWIGAGTVIIPGIRIGKNCVIGAGSVVCKDIPDGVKAYGNPCRIIEAL